MLEFKDTATGLTAQQLRERLDYAPDTGQFTRRHNVKGYFAGTVAGTTNAQGCRAIHIKGFDYKAHRLAWLHYYGKWPREEIDHEDGDPLNNRIDNLREATSTQNKRNRHVARSDSKTGVRGVREQNGKFYGRYRLNGSNRYVGGHATIAEAEAALKAAREKAYGEFAGM